MKAHIIFALSTLIIVGNCAPQDKDTRRYPFFDFIGVDPPEVVRKVREKLDNTVQHFKNSVSIRINLSLEIMDQISFKSGLKIIFFCLAVLVYRRQHLYKLWFLQEAEVRKYLGRVSNKKFDWYISWKTRIVCRDHPICN